MSEDDLKSLSSEEMLKSVSKADLVMLLLNQQSTFLLALGIFDAALANDRDSSRETAAKAIHDLVNLDRQLLISMLSEEDEEGDFSGTASVKSSFYETVLQTLKNDTPFNREVVVSEQPPLWMDETLSGKSHPSFHSDDESVPIPASSQTQRNSSTLFERMAKSRLSPEPDGDGEGETLRLPAQFLDTIEYDILLLAERKRKSAAELTGAVIHRLDNSLARFLRSTISPPVSASLAADADLLMTLLFDIAEAKELIGLNLLALWPRTAMERRSLMKWLIRLRDTAEFSEKFEAQRGDVDLKLTGKSGS